MNTKDFNANARYQRINELQAKNAISFDPYKAKRTRQIWDVLSLMSCIGMIALGSVMFVKGCVMPEYKNPPKQLDCQGCHGLRVKMTEYFHKAGSKTPDHMAEAVLATRSPRLLAAIAKVETGGNTHIRRAGYRKQHDGSFQVNPKHWGKVPYDAIGQAKQAEQILVELTEEYPIKTALSKYGGDSTNKYQKRILAELSRVP